MEPSREDVTRAAALTVLLAICLAGYSLSVNAVYIDDGHSISPDYLESRSTDSGSTVTGGDADNEGSLDTDSTVSGGDADNEGSTSSTKDSTGTVSGGDADNEGSTDTTGVSGGDADNEGSTTESTETEVTGGDADNEGTLENDTTDSGDDTGTTTDDDSDKKSTDGDSSTGPDEPEDTDGTKDGGTGDPGDAEQEDSSQVDTGGSGGGVSFSVDLDSVIELEREELTLNLSRDRVRTGEELRVMGELKGVDQESVDIEVDGRYIKTLFIDEKDVYSGTVSFTEPGRKEIRARSGDLSETATVTVYEPTRIDVLDVNAPQRVNVGERFQLCAESDATGSPTVSFYRDGVFTGKENGRVACMYTSLDRTGETEFTAKAELDGKTDQESTTVVAVDRQPVTAGPSGEFFRLPGLSWKMLMSLFTALLVTAGIMFRENYLV